jgi:uncharacterized protein (TIGR00730 family)
MKPSTELTATHSVCVFCGAKPGNNVSYVEQAGQIGAAIAKAGWRLVYGGGSNGLMGAVANGALANHGHVMGIITEHLVKLEMAHRTISELHIVSDMAVRKTRLIEEADVILVLPGGMGTLDELFEIVTLNQLAVTNMPIVLFNPNGFYNSMLSFVDHQIAQGFVNPKDWRNVMVASTVADCLALCRVSPS